MLSAANQIVQAAPAARTERRCQSCTPTVGRMTASMSTASPMVASSTAASTDWPNDAAKRAFMISPTQVNPTAVENRIIEVNMPMTERTGFGAADWLGISIRKARSTSCAATCCEFRNDVTTTLPRPPEACVMCPALTQAERLRRSFVSVHPNCWASSLKLASTRPTSLRYMSASSSSNECSAMTFAARATSEPLSPIVAAPRRPTRLTLSR